ncbi:ABC transporter permease [Labrys monachus]|uniref:Ribose/xylose/arabinose/galactoside ABC-type transport system permease subunit n=1 Tax=Labrys monachus TaxID=217067 RepID=A0ABU0FEP2_9HYPH|nr:ABC transporter permease [Labrys monachus]MDQ0393087.1 ribose/xylose/arabinose/galactoside ABC-type transport system permease subunit [Labrys monachus]
MPQRTIRNRRGGGRTLRGLLVTREAGVFAALLALCVVFALASPVFLTKMNILNLLRQISLLGVLSIGATYVLIISEVDLSVGSLYGFAGMVGGMLIVDGTPEILAILITLALGLAIGALNGAITVVGRIPSFITTLGTLYLIRGATLVMSNGMPVSLPHGHGGAPIITYIAQKSLLGGLSNQVLLLIVIAAFGFYLLHRTTFGFHIFAVGGNDRAARIIGVPVARTKVVAFAIAGLLAALAGIVNFGFLENVQPVTGIGLELDVIAAVIIGGTRLGGGEGSIPGTLLGVLLIGVVRDGLILLGVTPFWQTTLIGAVVLAAALIGGLTSKK